MGLLFFSNFYNYHCHLSEAGFMMSSYQKLRPILTAARKKYFRENSDLGGLSLGRVVSGAVAVTDLEFFFEFWNKK